MPTTSSACWEFTRPQQNQWGIGAGAPAFGLNNGRGDTPQLAMFNVPNNWSVDSSGKFTKDVETEQFRAALGYVRDLYAAGVFFPESVPLNSPILEDRVSSAARSPSYLPGWISYGQEFWDQGSKMTPPVKVRTIHPFSHDGGKPTWHQFHAAIGITAVKKGPPERDQRAAARPELLRGAVRQPGGVAARVRPRRRPLHVRRAGQPDQDRQGTRRPERHVAVPGGPPAGALLRAGRGVRRGGVRRFAGHGAGAGCATRAWACTRGPTAAEAAALLQQFSDGLLPIVTGRAPLSDFDQVLRDWRSGGGDQMRTEYQQAYADSQKG